MSEELVLASPSLPRAEQSAREGMHWMDVLANETDRLISEIDSFSDDQLFEMLNAGAAIERSGWMLRCAAANALLSRALPVPVRHEGDQTGEGKMALARQLADRTHLSVSTVIEDAKLWSTFFTPEAQEQIGDVSHLHDKTFYLTALRTEHPLEVLQEIAEEKLNNPSFNTGDARRLVAVRHAPSLSALMPSLANNKEVEVAFEGWKQATKRLLATVGPRGRQIAHSQLEEWIYELSLPEMTILDRIETLISTDGIDEIDQIAPRLGVDRQVVIAWFGRLREKGWLSYVEKERAPGARGASRKSWYFTQQYYSENSEKGNAHG